MAAVENKQPIPINKNHNNSTEIYNSACDQTKSIIIKVTKCAKN